MTDDQHRIADRMAVQMETLLDRREQQSLARETGLRSDEITRARHGAKGIAAVLALHGYRVVSEREMAMVDPDKLAQLERLCGRQAARIAQLEALLGEGEHA